MASSILLTIPAFASAHGHDTFIIGDKTYEFTVGSLNEPVAVDDKTGVDLTIKLLPTETEHAADEEHEGTPVEGLQTTLKAELIAGSAKKILDISPVYGKPGSYKAVFIPTIQTTYTYRIFGTINETPVDLSFSCNPAGHAVSPAWTGSEVISEGVTRIEKGGSFGCPAAKADLGFPEPSMTIVDIKESTSGQKALPIAGVALGALGCVLGLRASRKKPVA